MDYQKADLYIMTNYKYFPEEKLVYLKEKLRNIDDSRYLMITSVDLKDPTTVLVISLLLGSLGVDRFMLGDIGLGILKLLTLGVCGIMTIVDWFRVSNRAKEQNFHKIMMLL